MFTPHRLVLDAGYLIFYAKNCPLVVDVLALFALCNNLGSFATLTLKNTNSWILRRVTGVEAISTRLEDSMLLLFLHRESRLHARHRLTLSGTSHHESKISLVVMGLCVVGAGSRILVSDRQPTVLSSRSVSAKGSKLDPLRLSQSSVLSDLG